MRSKGFFSIVISGLSLFFSVSTLASSCMDTVSAIKNDMKNQSYASLQKLFGPPTEIKTINATLYRWPDYLLMIRDDGFKRSIGKLPEGKEKSFTPTLEEVISALGQPQSQNTEKWSEYTWRCPDKKTYLTVLSNPSGDIISGKSCVVDTSFSCNMFSGSQMNTSSNEVKMSEAVNIKVQGFAKNKLKEDMQNYSSHFNTTIKDKKQLETEVIERMKAYYVNLRICAPGTNQYAQPVFFSDMIFTVSVIEGIKDNRCIVNTSYDMSSQGKVLIKCKYKQESLAFYTDAEAETRARGEFSFNSKNLTPIQKAEATECQFYLDGELIPPLGI